jgi:hypothetical protein
MLRRILDFHLRRDGRWVADLDCGHRPALNANPEARTWVSSPEGRASHIGTPIECSACAR